MNDDAKALLICGAILFGAGNGTGFVGSRMTLPAPPAEVRFVHVPVPAALAPPVEAAAIEAAAGLPAATVPQVEPPAAAPPVEAKPLPQPRPKAEPKPPPKAQPKPEKEAFAKKPRAPAKRGLPSCAIVEREYQRMTMAERWAAYRSATPEQIAHGKRCLGF